MKNIYWKDIPADIKISETRILFIAHLPDGDAVVYWEGKEAYHAQTTLKKRAT